MYYDEWNEDKPTIIEYLKQPIGRFLLQRRGDCFYFCCFFLMPECQGRGIGSHILRDCIEMADNEKNQSRYVIYKKTE